MDFGLGGFWEGIGRHPHRRLRIEFWRIEEDFPCPMPPGPVTWFEYRRPKHITEFADRQEHAKRLYQYFPDTTGVLVQLMDNLEKATNDWTREQAGCPVPWYQHDQNGKPLEAPLYRPISKDIITAPYLVETRSFISHEKWAVGPLMVTYCWLSGQGELVDHNSVLEFNGIMPEKHETFGLENSESPAFLAMSLMNCKNVRVDSYEVPEKLARKHEKKGHAVPLPYRTLIIDQMMKAASGMRPQGGAGRSGIVQAMHITRGHFATYGMPGPDGRVRGKLFGLGGRSQEPALS